MTNMNTVLDQVTDQEHIDKTDIRLQYGQVYAIQEKRYGVTTMDESWWLPLAASCVLMPAVGDTVLFTVRKSDNNAVDKHVEYVDSSLPEQGLPDQGNIHHGFILSVLQRADENITAELNLPARSNAKLAALGIQAELLHTQGNTNISVWQQQTEITQNYRQISKSINVQADSRTTNIKSHDELKAGSQRIIVARDWRVRAQDTAIRADRQASLDGKQVRLG